MQILHSHDPSKDQNIVKEVGATICSTIPDDEMEVIFHSQIRAYQVFRDSNRAIRFAKDENQLLAEVCSIIVADGYCMAWVGYAEHDETKSVRPITQAGYSNGYIEQLNFTWANDEQSRDPIGTAIRTSKPVIVRDIRASPTLEPWQRAAIEHGYASLVALPLIIEQQTLGVLNIYSVEPVAFTENELELLVALIDDLAFGINTLRTRSAKLVAEEALRKSYLNAQQRLERLAALRNIDIAIANSLDLQLVLEILLDQVISNLQVDAATILLYQPDNQTLEFAAIRGFNTSALQHTSLKLGGGLAGRAALENRIIHTTDLENDQMDFLHSPFFKQEAFITYIGVPLISKGELRGVLEIFQRAKLNPEKEWLDFLEALAGQAAIAIDNANLYQHLQHSNYELTLAYDTTLEGWARALELRDLETEGHSRRVSTMTIELASALGMNDKELVHVRRGALLHDIGKMGIPDSILNKPGKLTDKEWDIMVLHPVYANKLLSPIKFLGEAIDIPSYHHEKWNGTGYPRGISKEKIPLAARIFTVVDVWDALKSDRPYRKAWPENKIIRYIQEESGKQFDPHIVSVFLPLVKKTEYQATHKG